MVTKSGGGAQLRRVAHYELRDHVRLRRGNSGSPRSSVAPQLRDRHRVYGRAVNDTLASLNVQQVVTAPATLGKTALSNG
jgi:hypothetical protein